MRATPPAHLVALLEELALASSREIRAVASRVGTAPREAADFESVWIDALRQAGFLTPYQAAELVAQRGRGLCIGPFLVEEKLPWPPYAACYRARRIGSSLSVRLTVVDAADDAGNGATVDALHARFVELAARGTTVQSPHVASICEAGRDGDRVWAAAQWTDGRPVSRWLIHQGRFPPEAVREIVAAMLHALQSLEAAGIHHGDICPHTVLLTDEWTVVLVDPGVRPIVRPREGLAPNFPAEAFGGLAPELAAGCTAHDARTDLFACGVLWWHLLCGRAPLSGGDAAAKLHAAALAKIADLRPFAPQTPEYLREMIQACTACQRTLRPRSFAEALEKVGGTMPDGAQCIAEALARQRNVPASWPVPRHAVHRSRLPLTPALIAVVCLFGVAIMGLLSMLSRGHHRHDDRPVVASSPKTAPPNNPEKEPRVVAAMHSEPAADPGLDWRQPIAAGTIKLAPSARIAPKQGGRLTIRIGSEPLRVEHEDVRFENCDFSFTAPSKAADALMAVACWRVEFRRCTFRTDGGEAAPAAAIRWIGPGGDRTTSALAGGRLKLTDCIFACTEAAIDCRQEGAAMILATNVLHTGSGPLVRWNHAPRADEPRRLVASLLTLRGSGPLVECCYDAIDAPGEMAIEADSCIFAPGKDAPLVRFSGTSSPVPLLAELRLTGQGSLLTTKTDVAQWRRADGSRETLDDSSLAIAGLVRGTVRFAGEDAADPASSLVVECRAPLLASDVPGINPATLPGGCKRD